MVKKDKRIISRQLFDIINNEFYTSELISGLAGDKTLSQEHNKLISRILKETGNDLYVKVLFYITYKTFSPEKAKKLWEEILKHKYYLSKVLKRNVEITVASLDYLTNIKDEIENPKLVGESFIGKIVELSSIDSLTKLYNRIYFFNKIKEEFTRFSRYNITFSIIMLDIDNFKAVNDKFGHQKGDEVLIKLGYIINSLFRELDTCARYGGEEFMILLPHTDIDKAYIIAERLRKKVENIFRKDLKVTVSIGISNCPKSSKTLKLLIKKVDEALYRSKKNGKNQTCIK
ncbi:MAG: GGDEF domain-containing protein [Spirochaetes bacterium]|nr:GGDEF domain-containing protein [Spirochaetota bacterium]